MQNTIRILIVEDEVLIAQDLKEILEEVGYEYIYKARNYAQSVEHLTENHIDLVLLDINLNDNNMGKTGVDVANYINQNFRIPFIFITSYSDADTILNVKQTRPAGFLLKPYNKEQLLASVEIALFNYSYEINASEKPLKEQIIPMEEKGFVMNNQLLVKDNYRYIKVGFNEILWFESDKNYVELITAQKKYLLRTSLKNLLEKIPPEIFVKCYKQYIINIKHVESFTSNTVRIKGFDIPISRNTQEGVLKLLKNKT